MEVIELGSQTAAKPCDGAGVSAHEHPWLQGIQTRPTAI